LDSIEKSKHTMNVKLSISNVWLALLTGLLLSNLGCSRIFMGIPGSGIAATENRDVEPFDKIEISGFGTVEVVFGDEHSLKVTTDDNLLEYVKTVVKDGTLQISIRENINPDVPLTFNVVTNDLNTVDISGAANLIVRSAQLDSLVIGASGACRMTADGTVDRLEVGVSGSGKIDADKLLAKKVKISISGAGKANVHASESLDASVSGAGLIQCSGDPADVSQSVSGVGRIQVGD
jgi:hypothetical protein